MYDSLYNNPWDRTFQLPNYGYPGSNASWRDTGVNESGFISSDDLLSTNNDFELGTSYLNNAYFMSEHSNNGTSISSSSSNPYAWETAFFARDVYHPAGSPFAAFANIWDKHASATNTTYVDSRVSLVDRVATQTSSAVRLGPRRRSQAKTCLTGATCPTTTSSEPVAAPPSLAMA